jgi:hypothetical protein
MIFVMSDPPELPRPGVPTRSDADIKAAAWHVGAEVSSCASSGWQQYAETRRRDESDSATRDPRLIRRDDVVIPALVIATYTSARALYDFFLGPIAYIKPNDISRLDFHPDADWAMTADGDAVSRMHRRQPRLHWYMAHLTWDRVSRNRTPAETEREIGIVGDPLQVASDVVAVAVAWRAHLDRVGSQGSGIFGALVELARIELIGGWPGMPRDRGW